MLEYRLASERDNEQLVSLAASSSMSGSTTICIERSPDFFSLLKMRGESKVFVAVNNNKIVGSLCVSVQQNYIDGKIHPVHYIGDFKVLPEFRRSGIGNNLCDELAKYMFSIDADLAFLTVASGNRKPLSFFKDRTGIPDFESIGTFIVYQLIGLKSNNSDLLSKVEQAEVNEELIDFFNNYSQGYQLGTLISKENLKQSELFIIRENGKINAAISLIDTLKAKQNVIIKMSVKDNMLIWLVNLLRHPFGISKLPETNEHVRMINIKYLAVSENKKELLHLLIAHARKIAFEKSYSFVSIGLHEKDPLNKLLPGFPKFTFRAGGMLLSMKNNKNLIEKVKQGIPFEDFSLV